MNANFSSTNCRQEFEKIVEGLSDGLEFSRTIGADTGPSAIPYEQGGGRGTLGEVDFYTRCVFPFWR
jgi:3-deoxy-7-phosphoheptulonate synthase